MHDGKLTKNNAIKTLAEWGPYYIISFDIFIHSNQTDFGSVVQLRKEADPASGEDGRKGYPGVFIRYPSIQFFFHLPDWRGLPISDDAIVTQQWINILVTQYYSHAEVVKVSES